MNNLELIFNKMDANKTGLIMGEKIKHILNILNCSIQNNVDNRKEYNYNDLVTILMNSDMTYNILKSELEQIIDVESIDYLLKISANNNILSVDSIINSLKN